MDQKLSIAEITRSVSGVLTADTLRQGEFGQPRFREAAQRHQLPEVLPGAAATMRVQFSIPQGAELEHWQLDLISEHRFWFSARGIQGPTVPVFGLSAE